MIYFYLLSFFFGINFQEPKVVLNIKQSKPIINWKGNFYSDDYRNFNEEGFTIKRIQNETRYSSFKLNFDLKNTLSIENVSNVLRCGNGILYINKALWYPVGNSSIIIYQEGQYSMNYNFKSKIQYDIKALKLKGEYFLSKDTTLSYSEFEYKI